MDQNTEQPKLLWTPSADFVNNANLSHYLKWLSDHKTLSFNTYAEVWKWSVIEPADFWESIWQYFSVKSHSPYEKVWNGPEMPGTEWFPGSTLNYAEHLFRHANSTPPAILFQSESQPLTTITWQELEEKVAKMAHFLKQKGVGKGDRVVAYLPNIPEATIAFLASCSLGAIWSSCSPDFGASSVAERFAQIEPKVLFTVDGYQYGGKPFSRLDIVKDLCARLPQLEVVVSIAYLNKNSQFEGIAHRIDWKEALNNEANTLVFEPVPFGHPIWVLYSSGTTGIPKAITHSHGGVLLEHYKYLAFHNDVKPGERFFWFSTTGWMMWNYVQASLLQGATIVLYDGSPGYPNLNVLWELTEKAKINHFGTSAPYLVACMKKELQPGKDFDLSQLRSIGSTGAPLPAEAFDWVYQAIKKEVWLCSMSGGTDVCTAFVGGCPIEPLYSGEIQCRALGCSLYAWDEMGEAVIDTLGEMVITEPMPSMPIYFWNDPGNERYIASYFEMYPKVWRHGDWVKITERGSLVIYGRSDATLNRHGVRIGTSEIYSAINQIQEIKDSLVINLELSGGRHYMPLFVVLEEGQELDENLVKKINSTLRSMYSPRHVPDEILVVSDIPYTISGKKLEAPAKKILMGIAVNKAANRDAMRNPEALDFFIEMAKKID
ncbi:MAG: acetoacetyl-CoA synthetase [Saprospiraceae bacterium]|nr:MAG: acetoacetyl-CoA synthetase [Saprospiraceae bacterium]